MLLTPLAEEIDRLTQELAEQKDKTMEAWVKMLDMVPKRHYDAAIGSMKVCQSTIETLMVELRKQDPASRAAADASSILAGLEAIITPDRMDTMEGGYNFKDRSGDSKIFGKIKREYKK
jgi:uncharacterized small protein (DUF1192 family)